jgi:hypothetical protein
MTTTCTACGAAGQSGAFCTVCGTPTVATGQRSTTAMSHRLEATTEPEMRESTRQGVADMLRAGGAGHQEPSLAGVGRRAAAYLLDVLAVSLVALVVGVVVALVTGVPDGYAALGEATTQLGAEAALTELLASLGAVYGAVGVVSLLGWVGLGLADGLTGRTPGNALLGLRTESADGAGPLGAGRGLLRWLILALSGVLPVVGTVLVLVSPSFDASGRRQGWQDKASRALVRDVRGVPPRSFAPAAPAAAPPAAAPQPPATAPGEPGAASPAAAPATPPAVAPAPRTDPWSFPAGDRAPSGGVITGVPGMAPPGPTPPQPGPPGAPPEPAPEPGPTPAPVPPAPTPTPAPAPTAAPTPAPTAAPAPSGAAPSGGDVGAAVEEDLEATRFSVSSRRSDGDAALPPRILVEVDPDRRVPVAARTLVGRNPQQDDGPAATLLRIADETRSVSKTHLELVPGPGGLRVTDLGSTNGSAVIAPDGTVRELSAGSPATVTAGWVVQAGARRMTVIGSDGGA